MQCISNHKHHRHYHHQTDFFMRQLLHAESQNDKEKTEKQITEWIPFFSPSPPLPPFPFLSFPPWMQKSVRTSLHHHWLTKIKSEPIQSINQSITRKQPNEPSGRPNSLCICICTCTNKIKEAAGKPQPRNQVFNALRSIHTCMNIWSTSEAQPKYSTCTSGVHYLRSTGGSGLHAYVHVRRCIP